MRNLKIINTTTMLLATLSFTTLLLLTGIANMSQGLLM